MAYPDPDKYNHGPSCQGMCCINSRPTPARVFVDHAWVDEFDCGTAVIVEYTDGQWSRFIEFSHDLNDIICEGRACAEQLGVPFEDRKLPEPNCGCDWI